MDHDPYGLNDRPFQLTPDPRFYYESSTHRKAMTYLGYGLAQGEGFIVVTGEVGTGKTMLVGRLMATIDRSRLTAINLVSTQLEGEDILRIVALALGVATDVSAKGQLLARIERFLHEQARGGKRTLLIVDEAQNLPISALEELRMLSNFQYGGQALLQIFLLGQPEFRDALAQPRFEQLRQRIIATHHLTAMNPDEAAPYIMHRLACAGWKGTPRFTQDAYEAFHRLSGGIPRRLNMLAGRVMLQGAIERLTDIDGDVVEDVASDLESESIMPTEGPLPKAQAMPSDYPDRMGTLSSSLPGTPHAPPTFAPQAQFAHAIPPQIHAAQTLPPQVQPAQTLPPLTQPAQAVPPPVQPMQEIPLQEQPAQDIPVQAYPGQAMPPYAPPAADPVVRSYQSYAPPEDPVDSSPYGEPARATPAPTPFQDNSPFTSLPENIPPPSIQQPPRYDGYVPPEEVPPLPVVASRTPSIDPTPPPLTEAAFQPSPPVEPSTSWAQPAPPLSGPPTSEAPLPAPPPPVAGPEIDYAARNAELEARLAEQEEMLRRTLSLLVELVETSPLPPQDPQGSGQGGSQDAA